MLSVNYAKIIRSLVHKKYRYEYNLFVAEGNKSVKDILRSGFEAVEQIFILPDAMDETAEFFRKWGDKIQVIHSREMAKISNLDSAPDMLMTGKIPPAYPILSSGLKPGIHLYLDQIQDPGNMGTILRTAEWFGVETIGLSEGCADIVHPKVIQASMGSFCRIQYWNGSLSSLDNFNHVPLLGADLHGADVYRFQLPEFGILIIGSEGQGISAQVRSRLSQTIKIPAYSNQVESLNAATATAILLAEWQRQIHSK